MSLKFSAKEMKRCGNCRYVVRELCTNEKACPIDYVGGGKRWIPCNEARAGKCGHEGKFWKPLTKAQREHRDALMIYG